MGSMIFTGAKWYLQILRGCAETYEEWKEETDEPLYSNFLSNDAEFEEVESYPGLKLRSVIERAKPMVDKLVEENQLDPDEDLIVLVYLDDYEDEESLDDYDEDHEEGEGWEAVLSDPLFGDEAYMVLWPPHKVTENPPILGEIIPASRERELVEKYGESLAGYFDDDAGSGPAGPKND